MSDQWSRRLLQLSLCLASAAMLAGAEPPDSALRVHVEGDRAGGLISIQGLDQAALARIDKENATPARWASLCGIFVRPGDGSPGSFDITLTGSYRVRGTTLEFVSRYPLDQPGYRVRV